MGNYPSMRHYILEAEKNMEVRKIRSDLSDHPRLGITSHALQSLIPAFLSSIFRNSASD
jgi:hypothetical protein